MVDEMSSYIYNVHSHEAHNWSTHKINNCKYTVLVCVTSSVSHLCANSECMHHIVHALFYPSYTLYYIDS